MHPSRYLNICVFILTVTIVRSQVQRIVITSSCASVLSLSLSKPTVFSEQDWNLGSIKDVQEMGDKSPSTAYHASKTLAEKCGVFYNILSFGLPLTCFLQSAAWDFYELHKDQIKWDLAVINPPFVSCFFTDIKKTSSPTANGRITAVRSEQ